VARIVFAWEFGAGLRHILYDLPLARKLLEKRHEVFCVMKNVVDVKKVMGPHRIKGFLGISKEFGETSINKIPLIKEDI